MILLIILLLVFAGEKAPGQSLPDNVLRKIAFDEKPGAVLSLDLPFRDENGKSVRLGDYFDKRPVILVLCYYGCPMLCTLVLNGLVGGLQDIKPEINQDYVVVNVSIDPHEKPELAAAKKNSYITRFGRLQAAAGWHFLTGDQSAIQQLAAEVGFNYEYDAASHQYAHPSGILILSSKGKISHYLTGVVFSKADLTKALSDATEEKVGSPVEQIFLLCFRYSPMTGKYSGLILTLVRLVSIGVVLAVMAVIAGAWRRTRAASPRKG
jgi:protein SCO1/2